MTISLRTLHRIARELAAAGLQVERTTEGCLGPRRRRIAYRICPVGCTLTDRGETITACWVSLRRDVAGVEGPGYWAGLTFPPTLAGVAAAMAALWVETLDHQERVSGSLPPTEHARRRAQHLSH